jgi:hypothetical protein
MIGNDLALAPVDHLVSPRRIALVWLRERTMRPLHETFVALTRGTCESVAAARSRDRLAA